MTLQTRFIAGAIAFVVAIAGLLTAANSADANFYWGGLAVAVIGLAVCWLLIKGHFDRWERDPNRPRRPIPPTSLTPDKPSEEPSLSVPAGPTSYQTAVTPPQPQTGSPAGNWIRGAVIGLVGLVGLFVAASGSGFAYWGGLLIFVLAILLIFQLIGRAFARAPAQDSGLPVPGAGFGRWIAGVAAGLVALISLFIAGAGGAGYYLGIMAAIMAIAYIFYLMKIGFDEAEHR